MAILLPLRRWVYSGLEEGLFLRDQDSVQIWHQSFPPRPPPHTAPLMLPLGYTYISYFISYPHTECHQRIVPKPQIGAVSLARKEWDVTFNTQRMPSSHPMESAWALEWGYLFPGTSKCCGYLITSDPSSNHSGLYYAGQQILLTLIYMSKREGYFSLKVLWKILHLLIFPP